MRFYYLNSKNERINFYDSPYILLASTLLDYTYSYTKKTRGKYEKIDSIKREIEEKEIEIAIASDKTLPLQKREEQFANAANRLIEVTEYDVCVGKRGRIYTEDGYYIEGYILENVKNDMFFPKRFMGASFKFVSDYPVWCREKTFSFKANTQAITDAETKEEIDSILDNASTTPDYPWDYKRDFKTKYRPIAKKRVRDYKYDFYHNHTIGKLDNDHYAASDFKMIVYGPCTKPFIQIGGHIYEVFTTLYDGEYMVIDSRSRTIKKYTRYGVEENILGSRSREHYIFEKIPSGKLTVKWNAQYPFDVILYQERSEPPWRLS